MACDADVIVTELTVAVDPVAAAPNDVLAWASTNAATCGPSCTRASRLGFHTAFVRRPTEHGPNQTTDLEPKASWDVVAEDFVDLAKRLGC